MQEDRTRLLRWDDLFIFIGPLSAVAPHQHRATALLLAGDAPLRIRVGADTWQTAFGAIIPPGLHHELDCGNHPVAVVYFDPLTHGRLIERQDLVVGDESADWVRKGRALVQRALSSADPAASRQTFRSELQNDIMLRAGLRSRYASGDARLLELRQLLENESGWNRSLASASAQVGLSSFHFSHMFTEKIGLAWTAYRNWMRLLATCAELAGSNATLTRIALDGGYSSPAHFSASFRATFGITPSQVRPREIQLPRFHRGTANI